MQGRPTALTEHIIMPAKKKVVTAREQHDPTALGGYHYHIAIHCSDASKNTAHKIVGAVFDRPRESRQLPHYTVAE